MDAMPSPPKKATRRKAQADMPLAFDSLPSLLGFHVRLANIAMIRDFMTTLENLDMTQRQSAILMLVGANPGVSQIALAELLSTDRATMMAMVDKLEGRGYLERKASSADRRLRSLHLTADGRRMVANLRRKIAEHERHFIARFSAAEFRQFLEFLSRVHRKF
jgi:DNA-binding MarR family transcriptional regulator